VEVFSFFIEGQKVTVLGTVQRQLGREMNKARNLLRNLSFLFAGLLMLPLPGTATGAEAIATDLTQEQFLQAMRDRARGNLHDAATTFNNILTSNPQLHRARLELAVTYRRLHEYTRAKEMAQEVLDDPKTPPNVRVTVLAFIAQLDQDAKRMAASSGHHWRPEVGLGWLYDTNVNAGPGTDLFEIGNAIWTLNPASQPTSDSATIINAGLTHQYRTGKSVKVGQSNAVFLWQDYANYNRRDYNDKHDFDQDVLTVATGPALVATHNWRASLSVQADYIRLGSEDLAWFLSLLPSVTKQLANDAWEITLDGGITARDYQQGLDSGRDSTYYTGQLSIGYTFAKARVSLQVGTSAYDEDADADFYSYDGIGVYGSATWRPWTDGSVFGRLSERTLNYDEKEFPFPEARDERVRQYAVGASHTFKSDHRWLNNLTMAANFVFNDNFSNVATHEFDREQTILMLSKAF